MGRPFDTNISPFRESILMLLCRERAKTRKAGESERTDYEITRPGFTRLNFPYFISDEETDFIISAVGMVAKNGWTLLPQYEYIPTSGQWNHLDYYQVIVVQSWSVMNCFHLS